MTDQEDFQRFARKVAFVAGLALACWMAVVLRDLIILFLGGVVLAAALTPLIEAAAVRRLPRGLTILLVVSAVVAAIALFLLSVVPTLIRQGSQLAASLPALIAGLTAGYPQTEALKPLIRGAGQLSIALQVGLSQGLALALRAANSLGNLVLVGLITLMLTLGGAAISQTLLRLLPEAAALRLAPLLPEMSTKLAGYVTGTGISCLIQAAGTFIILKLLGVPYALLLAVTLGIITILPIVGGLLGMLPATAVAFLISPWKGLWTFLALFVFIQIVVGNVIGPYIMRRTIDIHPLVVLFAVTFGGKVGGLGGAIVAVPMAAALQVLIEHLYMRPPLPYHRGDEPSQA